MSASTTSKRCNRCSAWKPLDEFHRHRRKADGRATTCKVCACRAKREDYWLRHDTMLERAADWRETHRDKIRDADRDYRRENAEAIRERDRARYASDAEQIRERDRARYAADPEAIRRKNRESHRRNAEARNARRRARRAAAKAA